MEGYYFGHEQGWAQIKTFSNRSNQIKSNHFQIKSNQNDQISISGGRQIKSNQIKSPSNQIMIWFENFKSSNQITRPPFTFFCLTKLPPKSAKIAQTLRAASIFVVLKPSQSKKWSYIVIGLWLKMMQFFVAIWQHDQIKSNQITTKSNQNRKNRWVRWSSNQIKSNHDLICAHPW